MGDRTVKVIIYGMVVLMGAFIFFLFFRSDVSPGTVSYFNGYDTFEVEQVDSGHGPTYKIKIFVGKNGQPYYIYTRFGPKETESLDFERNLTSKVVGKNQVYVAIDPFENLTGETTLAALEIDKFIDNKYLFNTRVDSAFTKPYQNYTVKTCEDANNETSVIVLTLGADTRAYSVGECVMLQGATQSDITRLADGLAFRMLSIVR